jgi:hypothetical protein
MEFTFPARCRACGYEIEHWCKENAHKCWCGEPIEKERVRRFAGRKERTIVVRKEDKAEKETEPQKLGETKTSGSAGDYVCPKCKATATEDKFNCHKPKMRVVGEQRVDEGYVCIEPPPPAAAEEGVRRRKN